VFFQPKEGRLAWTHIRNSAIKAFLALHQPSRAFPRALSPLHTRPSPLHLTCTAAMIQWVAQTFELGDPLVDARAAILTDLYALHPPDARFPAITAPA
jgi:hypothetical protein